MFSHLFLFFFNGGGRDSELEKHFRHTHSWLTRCLSSPAVKISPGCRSLQETVKEIIRHNKGTARCNRVTSWIIIFSRTTFFFLLPYAQSALLHLARSWEQTHTALSWRDVGRQGICGGRRPLLLKGHQERLYRPAAGPAGIHPDPASAACHPRPLCTHGGEFWMITPGFCQVSSRYANAMCLFTI